MNNSLDSKKIINAFIAQISGEGINPIFGDIEISGGKIVSITEKPFSPGLLGESSTEGNVYNAAGRLVTIPLVNFHDHIYSRLAKGLNITGDLSNFPNILKNLWWKLDLLLDEEMNYASAEMTALESIRNGVTYIFDHHASPSHTKGSLNTIKSALSNFGLRGVLCFETTNRYGDELANAGLDENIDFAHNSSNADFKGMIGLHASFTVDDYILDKTREAISGTDLGIHVHLCEDLSDKVETNRKYDSLPVQRFIDAGLVNSKSIFAHSIHLDESEISLIGERGASAALNLDSNLNNAVGLAKYANLNKSVSLLAGTDGMHANLARSAKQIFLLARHTGMSMDDAFGYFIRLYFTQIEFVKKYFSDYTSLSVGDRADMIVWDYVMPTPLTQGNFFGHYIYGALEYPVRTVIQNGNFLMKDFLFTASNETEVRQRIYTQGVRLKEKFEAN